MLGEWKSAHFSELFINKSQYTEKLKKLNCIIQNPQDGRSRLKRWIMIGDHHQLPPVVQNLAYQKYSNMEQSLFARFVRLGVPYVLLDQQGRARAEYAIFQFACLGIPDIA